jgi:hypothetical protein
MTKADHPDTIKAARKFKKQLDETLLADVPLINQTPFESEIYYTAGKISQLLTRLIGVYDN